MQPKTDACMKMHLNLDHTTVSKTIENIAKIKICYCAMGPSLGQWQTNEFQNQANCKQKVIRCCKLYY